MKVYRGTDSRERKLQRLGMYTRYLREQHVKAIGLAGLRIVGVAAPEMIEALWRRHEYAVIAAAGRA